jgi:hypothetical protein
LYPAAEAFDADIIAIIGKRAAPPDTVASANNVPATESSSVELRRRLSTTIRDPIAEKLLAAMIAGAAAVVTNVWTICAIGGPSAFGVHPIGASLGGGIWIGILT